MISIKKVLIKNFQSHEDTNLEFLDGLNVIVGPSDHGKSAIIRAIKWVLYNEPRGTEFIKHGKQMASVSLEFSNGVIITRERSQSRNRYILVEKNGTKSIFEGFGNHVPDQVLESHGIHKVFLDDDLNTKLNISEQLEGAFLISESGAIKAKAIGRIAYVHVIDAAMKRCVADIRRENQSRDQLIARMQKIDEEIEKYRELDVIGANIKECGEQIKEIQEQIKVKEIMEKRLAEITTCNVKCYKIRQFLSRTLKLDEGWADLQNAELLFNKLNRIKSLNDKLQYVKNQVRKINRILECTKQICSGELNLIQVKDKSSKVERLKNIKIEYDSTVKNILNKRKFLDENKLEIEEKAQKYAEILKAEEVCPFCNQAVDDRSLDQIIKRFLID